MDSTQTGLKHKMSPMAYPIEEILIARAIKRISVQPIIGNYKAFFCIT